MQQARWFFSAASCNDSFLQQDYPGTRRRLLPEKLGRPALYLNGLYPSISQAIRAATPRRCGPYAVKGSPIAYGDLVSDNLVGYTGAAGNPINRLDVFNVPNSGTSTGWGVEQPQKVNYFLRHCFNASGPMADIGEICRRSLLLSRHGTNIRSSRSLARCPGSPPTSMSTRLELYAPRYPREQLSRRLDPLRLDYAVEHLSRAAMPTDASTAIWPTPQSPLLPFRGHLPQISPKTDVAPMPTVPGGEEKFLPCMRGSLARLS